MRFSRAMAAQVFAAGKSAAKFVLLAAIAGIEALAFRDVLMFGGVALLGYGLSLVYWPAAFVVPGLILTGVAIFGVKPAK
jgi:hypothetical protein